MSGPFIKYPSARGSLQSPPPFAGSGCFECGDLGHMKRHCPRLSIGSSQQSSQPSTSAPITAPPVQSARGGARSARGRLRGGGQSRGGHDHFYVLHTRPDAIASDIVITSIVSVCHLDASVLFDPGSTYSYVSSYFTHYLDMPYESIASSVYVSTPVGDTIVVDYVCRSYIVTIGGLETRVDLLLLSIVDFDVIFGMEWLSPYHAILDCFAKTVRLAMPGLPQIE
ncbi:uncharacterized protein [Nicotiana sylvestris]|uniref:uncharacterized protein n=1 Tax=Nicotiana sylvestris TaxID=4096 RepID=UPI00388CB712